MRLIWKTSSYSLVDKYSQRLEEQAIDFFIEEKICRDWNTPSYGAAEYLIWIVEEDQTEKAKDLLKELQQEPEPSETTQPFPATSIRTTKKSFIEEITHTTIRKNPEYVRATPLTFFIIFLSSLLFFLEIWTDKEKDSIPPVIHQTIIPTSPIHKAFLIDYPRTWELVDKIVHLYGIDALQKPETMETAGKFLYDECIKTPFWQGIYPAIVESIQRKILSFSWHIPLLEKAQEGEVWRIITPIFLHNDILHIFFNMIWVLILATQIEQRLGRIRFAFFILIVAATSNICQYIVSGPNFLGFSGVICAMATFIRTRQRQTPWEGYQMTKSTFHFICYFIAIMACISCISFILAITKNIIFPIAIANTAHISGALCGWFLGTRSFFSWNYKENM